MAQKKNFDHPDSRVEFGGVVQELVEIGDYTVGRTIQPPGWRWSQHIQPLVGGEWCMARHIGVVISGREATVFPDACAGAIRETCGRQGIRVRAGVHVGEVELHGTQARGIAVHEVAPIGAVAEPDQILVSGPTRALCRGSGMRFEDRASTR